MCAAGGRQTREQLLTVLFSDIGAEAGDLNDASWNKAEPSWDRQNAQGAVATGADATPFGFFLEYERAGHHTAKLAAYHRYRAWGALPLRR